MINMTWMKKCLYFVLPVSGMQCKYTQHLQILEIQKHDFFFCKFYEKANSRYEKLIINSNKCLSKRYLSKKISLCQKKFYID